MAAVELEEIAFAYPGTDAPVFEDLSLSIADGEAHALLGASGAGKTTLLNLLSGLLFPSRGRIVFNGEDVSQADGFSRRVAQVFQFPVLYESMNVWQNLTFPLQQARQRRGSAGWGRRRQELDEESRRRVHDVVAELELEAQLQSPCNALSLYQKQLVAVAKALVRTDVSVVLLDEPLTAVEPRRKWRLRQVLKRAQADFNVTMVYVTHDQTEALTFADRVSVMTADGSAQTGTPGEIYQHPASPFVGRFVGSPGMNVIDAALLHKPGLDPAGQIGFRPEWGRLVASGTLAGVVTSVVAQGTRHTDTVGVTGVRVDGVADEIFVSGPLRARTGERVAIEIERLVEFPAR